MLISGLYRNGVREIKCYLSKSKLIICEYNAFYFSEIAFIGFTLHEIKQGIVFLGTPGKIIPQIQIVQSGSLVCAAWAWN